MRALLIEDDISVAHSVGLILKSESFSVHHVETGEVGIAQGKQNSYDVILLDMMLPDLMGWEVIARLRAAQVKTPILVVSGLSSIGDKVRSLTLGADDYICKPFNARELVARIYAILRRTKGHAETVIVVDDLEVRLDHKIVEVNGNPVPLTGKEYRLLEVLALRKGAAISKRALLTCLYGGIDEPEIKIIDVFICKLRKKLARASGGKRYIETVSGCGYVLGTRSSLSSSDQRKAA
jgi:two-component system cell cycle response regulator CtrA